MTASEPTILVTGANGYVAGHIVNELLNRGCKVRGTVRSEKAASQIRNTFPCHVDTQLTIAFVQDLTNPDAFCDAIDESITAVIHTASPACYLVDNVVHDMLHPAIKGATGVLGAVEKFADKARFTKFVHLSSFAAMLDHSKGKRVGHVYTEEDWNPVTFEEAAQLDDAVMAYEAAKALSERAVWAWMDKHQPSFKLTCVNPSLILGPHVETLNSLFEVRSTARFLWGLVDASSISPLDFAGFVDVRDAAAMMVAVLQTPAADGRRFLVAHHFDWQSAADAAREGLPQVAHRIPVGEPGTGRAKAEREIYMADGRNIVEVTGVGYRSLQQTIVDTLRQFLEVESRS